MGSLFIKMFFLVLCTLSFTGNGLCMEIDEDSSTTCTTGSDELLSTSSEQCSNASPRDRLQDIVEEYMQSQNGHYTIVSIVLKSKSSKRLEYLEVLAKTPAVFDHYTVEKFEATNAYLALKTGDLAIINFVLDRIRDFSIPIYDNVLIEAVQVPKPLTLLHRLKATPSVNFAQKIDRCLMSLSQLDNVPRELIAFFINEGADKLAGLSWYFFNNHIKDVDVYAQGIDVDTIYKEILKPEVALQLEKIIALSKVTAPKEYELWYEIFSYACKEKSLRLIYNLLKLMINDQKCRDRDFDTQIPMRHLSNVYDFTTSLIQHIALLCNCEDFFDYCKNPQEYTELALMNYSHTAPQYLRLKKICWWASLFNHSEVIKLFSISKKLSEDDFFTLINERGPHGFTAVGYNALFNNSNLTFDLISKTKKEMDLVIAARFALEYNYPIGAAIITYLTQGSMIGGSIG